MITQILHHQARRINMEFQKLIEEIQPGGKDHKR